MSNDQYSAPAGIGVTRIGDQAVCRSIDWFAAIGISSGIPVPIFAKVVFVAKVQRVEPRVFCVFRPVSVEPLPRGNEKRAATITDEGSAVGLGFTAEPPQPNAPGTGNAAKEIFMNTINSRNVILKDTAVS